MKKISALFTGLAFLIVPNIHAQSWKLAGNALTGTEALGSKNAFDVNFISKNLQRMTIKADGRIGFGIANPQARFNFYGLTRIDDSVGTSLLPLLILNGRSNNATIELRTNDSLKTIFGYDQSGNSFNVNVTSPYISSFAVNRATGNVLIGNSLIPSAVINVFGHQVLDGDLTMASTLGKGDINFTTDQQNIAFAAPGSSSSAMIYMTNNASTTNRRMVLARGISNGSTGLQYEFSGDAFNFMKNASSRLRIDMTAGRVGINDNTPSYPLDVNGYTQIIGNLGVQTAPNTRTIQAGNTQGALIGIGTIEYIQDAGTNLLSFNENLIPVSDNVWTLGNSTNQWKEVWAIDGTINKSDARDKSNIRDLNYGLKEIMQLHPVKFNWKSNPAEGDKLGVIAQEIQKVLPEVVRDWQYQVDEQTGKKTKISTDKLGVMYADIIPVLIHGLQEQQKEIEDLKLQVQQVTGNVSGSKQTAAGERSVAENFMLMQNTPNPFYKNTMISYNLNTGFKTAQIVINDNSGRTVKTIALNTNKGSVVFDGSVLPAGTYYYSLVADGKLFETKTMMISK